MLNSAMGDILRSNFTFQCSHGNPNQLIFPGQNGRHFADDIFRCIFVNEFFFILITISLKFVRKGPIDNNPALALV